MKLNNNQLIFAKLMLKLTEHLYKDTKKDVNGLFQEQKKNRDEILLAIASIMLSYKIINDKMNLTKGDYFKNKDSMGKLIKDKFNYEVNFEVASTKNIISDVANKKYNINNYLNNKSYKKIDDKKVDKLINEKIKDKTVSDRIKNNKNEMYKHTQKRVDDFLKGKISVNDIEKEIKAIYNTNADNTKRLVNDQIARAQSRANEEWFKNNNIEWVMYDATLDKKTCSDCGSLDGKTYQRKNDRPDIPTHVSCRCCYIGLPDKDWRPDKRLDQENRENIDYKTYKEWYNKNIDDTGAIGKRYKDDDKRKDDHAKRYYESVRKMKNDVDKISNNTGFSVKQVEQIKNHVFIEEHDLIGGVRRFDPDFEISKAWQRLIEGKNIKNSDLVLLNHEWLELKLMNRYNYKYGVAHEITCRKYDYLKALREEEV